MSKQTPRKRAKQTTINEALGIATTPKRPRLDIDTEEDIENRIPMTTSIFHRLPAASWHQEDASELIDKNKMATKLADEMRKELAFQALNHSFEPNTEQTITTRTLVQIAISNDSTMSDKESPITIEKQPFTFHTEPNKPLNPIFSATQVFDQNMEHTSITRSEADLVCTNPPSETEDQTRGFTEKIILDSTNISINPIQDNSSTSTGLTSSNRQTNRPTPSIQGSLKDYIDQAIAKAINIGQNQATPKHQPIETNTNANRMYHAVENREEALDYFRKTAKHNRTLRTALPFLNDPGLHRMLFQEGLIPADDMHLNDPEYDANMNSNEFPTEEPMGLKVTCGLHGNTSKESRIIQAFPDGARGPCINNEDLQFDVH